MPSKTEARDAHKQAMVKSDPRVLELRNLLTRAQKQITDALPKHLKAERMIRIATSAVQRNPGLLNCDQLSIVKSVIDAAEIGLEPASVLGHAALVPYYNGRTKRMEAQLQVMYRGFIELALRTDKITHVAADVVYGEETFWWRKGMSPDLVHTPPMDRDHEGPITHAYAIAYLKEGGPPHPFEVLTVGEIERFRQRSPAEQSREKGKIRETPWVTDYAAMCKKTAVRQLSKFLQLSPQLSAAATIDEQNEAGVDRGQAIEVDFALTDEGRENENGKEASNA